MRRLTLSLIALAVLAVPAGAGEGPPLVKLKDDFFTPTKVTIQKGGKVVYRWKGENEHNVAILKQGTQDVKRRSGVKTSGKFTHEFRRAGSWRVICEIHPDSMKMKVVVKQPS